MTLSRIVERHIACEGINAYEFKEIVVIVKCPLEVDDVNIFGCLEGDCYVAFGINYLTVNAVAVVGRTGYYQLISGSFGGGLNSG